MKKQPIISNADYRLFAPADLLKKERSKDELALVCVNLMKENAELQAKIIAVDAFHEKKAIELKAMHDAHILQVRREHETNSKVYEAEVNEALGHEAIDSKLEQITTELTIPLVGNAYIAGQKDGGKARAKVAAHKSHEDDYKNKSDAFQWFDKNFQLFPKAMDECASAAVKEIPVEFSTARNWLREWRKTQKRNI